MLRRIPDFAMDYPMTTIVLALFVTFLFAAMFPSIHIDTDPENMLEAEQPDRVFYQNIKKDFGIHDLIVLGIEDSAGIFREETLTQIDAITEEILRIPGVIYDDVVSLTTTDDVSISEGFLRVHPVMETIPDNQNDALSLKQSILSNPLFAEKLVSMDGTAVAIYIPIESKKDSYRISNEIEAIAARYLKDGQRHYIAGLPMAEDTFGYAMFEQMGITAPLAGMTIFLLLFLIFRKLILIIPPMVVAMLSVVWAMGLLIGSGFTVHIMSSMIPVFLMPIAVLDGVHILSEFVDRYPICKDRRIALKESMERLFTPMLYTSMTSAVGFFSLVLAPIPPVRVFGAFVAFGILVAWFLTITFVPASIILIPERRLAKLAARRDGRGGMRSILRGIEGLTFNHHKWILVGGAIVLILGIVGVMQVRTNDNPVKWFKSGHPIRVADDFMNQAFGGTYMAYLVAEGAEPDAMKDPEVLLYLNQMQRYLEEKGIVGKTTSLADIVKRVNFVLRGEDPEAFTIPDSKEAVAQEIFLFLSSGDPGDLDDFVDYNYQNANIWVQMKSGDNRAMEEVEEDLAAFISKNPIPQGITLTWSGLTYINKVWQDLMVFGMLKAVLGGFLVVFVLMVILFRSLLLSIVSMVPLSFAMIISYGLVGIVGKDYDMPIAVCSSLSLGLAIDFAIHFIQRFRRHYQETGSLEEAHRYIMGEPGRAIARNAIVITLGFLPMALSILVPYITVGIFFALLMLSSALSTLLLLPALMRFGGKRLLGGAVYRRGVG